MNPDTIYKLWSGYLDGTKLSESDEAALMGAIDDNPDLLREFIDDRAIDNLISLTSDEQNASDPFILQCMTKFEKLELSHAPRAASDRIAIETKNSFAGKLNVARTKQKKALAKWGTAVLAIASLILVGSFIFVISSPEFDGVSGIADPSDKTTDSATDETNSETDWRITDTLPSINSIPLNDPIDTKGDLQKSRQIVTNKPQESNREPPIEKERVVQNEIPPGNLPNVDILTGPTLATVTSESNAKFSTAIPAGRLGAGLVKLLFGEATITMDNSAEITLIAPVEINIASSKQVLIKSGKVRIEAPLNQNEFEIRSPGAVLSNLDQANVYMLVNSKGTEVVLSGGQCELNRLNKTDNSQAPRTVTLATKALSHAFINATKSENSTPGVVVAHGAGKYLGQIVFKNDSYQASTPAEFEQIFNRFDQQNIDEDRPSTRIENVQLFQQLNQFHEMFRQIQQVGSGGQNDIFNHRSYSFQGEIMIDGKKVEFTNPADFKYFSDRLKKRNRP